MHFNKLKANCQTKKYQPVVLSFNGKIFVVEMLQQKMFTVRKKKKERKKNLTAKILDRYIQLHILYIIPLSKSYHVWKHYLTKVRNFPSVKFQRVNTFFFAWHVFSIKTTQLCCFGVQAATENMNINRYDRVLIKFFYQSGLGLDSVCGVPLASLL